MPNQMSEDQEKIDEYLGVIQERILVPIQNTEVQRSCTATLLLLFAAIDGLGKLLVPDDKARWLKQRICGFLDYMGGDYAARQKELLALRNSLVHNAINVETFLSHIESGSDLHLKKIDAGLIYVNTMVMYKDFVDSFTRFRFELQHDLVMMRRAVARLEWVETVDRLEWKEDNPLDQMDSATPTHPSPVRFIRAK